MTRWRCEQPQSHISSALSWPSDAKAANSAFGLLDVAGNPDAGVNSVRRMICGVASSPDLGTAPLARTGETRRRSCDSGESCAKEKDAKG